MLSSINKLGKKLEKINKEYIFLFFILVLVGCLINSVSSISQVGPEEITLSTLYPSPFGEYNEIMLKRMIDYDDITFLVDPTGRSEMHQIQLNDRDTDGSSSIEADEKGDLILDGKIYGTNVTAGTFYIDLNNIEPMDTTKHWTQMTQIEASIYVNSLRTKSFIQMGACTPDYDITDPTKPPTVPPFEGNHVYDLAEGMIAKGDCEAGDVVIISPDEDCILMRSNKSYATDIAGVISESPKLYLGANPGNVPLALAGIVPCKVSTENGSIKRGDLLISAAIPGHAMRAEANQIKAGMLIGKALQPLTEGIGKVLILVNKQ